MPTPGPQPSDPRARDPQPRDPQPRDLLREPSHRRLAHDAPRRAEILVAHAAAVARGHDCYQDPATGYAVMTAAALLARGTCCSLGCRHCPYVR